MRSTVPASSAICWPPPAAVEAAPRPAYTIISDAELLALLRDRPVILVADSRGLSQAIFPEN